MAEELFRKVGLANWITIAVIMTGFVANYAVMQTTIKQEQKARKAMQEYIIERERDTGSKLESLKDSASLQNREIMVTLTRISSDVGFNKRAIEELKQTRYD